MLFHSNQKFTYCTFSKTNMKNRNYSRYLKQWFPAKNWIKPFGELLNLAFKNNAIEPIFFLFLHLFYQIFLNFFLWSYIWSQNKTKYRSNLWNHKNQRHASPCYYGGDLFKGYFLQSQFKSYNFNTLSKGMLHK